MTGLGSAYPLSMVSPAGRIRIRLETLEQDDRHSVCFAWQHQTLGADGRGRSKVPMQSNEISKVRFLRT